MKLCKKCGVEKDHGFFSKCSAKKDGLQTACKDCKKNQLDTWRKLNSKKWGNYKKEWYLKNPGNSAVYARRRRASIAGNGFSKYSEAEVLEKYGNFCHLCQMPIGMELNRKVGSEGWQQSLHIDHVVPISRGGEDSLENVRPSHAICNLIKSANVIQ